MSDTEEDYRPTHTRKLGNKQFAQYLKSQPTTTTLIFNIEKFLSQFDPFYYNSFLSKIKARPLQKIEKQLAREYEDLLKGKSFFHKINHAIESRNKCIEKIKRELRKVEQILKAFKKAYFKANSQKDEIVLQYTEGEGFTMIQIDESIEKSIQMIQGLFTDMSRLRDMTIYLIQTIHRWRIQLEEWMDKCSQHSRIDYFYEGKRYYNTLLEDTSFIWESKLCEYIWLEEKQDPLIIRNVLKVDEREKKEILEKYFLEILSPKSDEIIEKSIKCLEMLQYEYKPQQINLYEEEEKLIENYLSLERKNNQLAGLNEDPEEEAKQFRKQIEEDNYRWYNNGQPELKKKENRRGWVFGRRLHKPATDKVRQIVNKHEKQMNYIAKHKLKPYNIVNYSQKNSIALGYLEEKKKTYTYNPYGKVRNMNNILYNKDEDGELISQEKGSEDEMKNKSKKMYNSLTKFNNLVIHEDPKEYQPDTPKRKKKGKPPSTDKSKILLKESRGRETLNHNIKINTIVNPPIESANEEKAQIEVDGEEAPMNLRQFFEVFRADTDKDLSKDQKVVTKQKLKSFSVKKLVDRKKAESLKHLPYYKKKSMPKKMKKETTKQKSKEDEKSFQSFTKVEAKNLSESKIIGVKENQFISIESKRITNDMIGMYARHLMNHLPITTQSFTNYSQRKIISVLEDIDIHCMIFDIKAEGNEHIGQALVVESLSNRMRLRYEIEFINVGNFQLLLSSISRIAEELLSTTPCEEVLCKLMEDKFDPVSVHFINLIDAGLKYRGQKFSLFHILEKSVPGYTGKDMHERMYVFESKKNLIRDQLYKKKMMSNYRSLTFETKCLLLSSNFKLRSQNLLKDLIQTYKDYSIGSLFIRILSKIMSKYHMKQIKIASMSVNDVDQKVGFIKNHPFLRSLFYGLLQYSKNIKGSQNEADWLKIHLTKFTNMTDLLNYLNYKEYDQLFKFDFLNESRFILNHQLHISEVNINLSLEFVVNASPEILILNNNRNYVIQSLTFDDATAYLVPTTLQGVKLLLMDGRQYDACTDRLDLFTYLQLFFRNSKKKQLHDIPQIAIPNLSKKKAKVYNVKAYEGLSRLFPERQFYSATMFGASNLWQGFYPNAVICLPEPNSIILEYPLIVGFYDQSFASPIVTFFYKENEVETLSQSKLVVK